MNRKPHVCAFVLLGASLVAACAAQAAPTKLKMNGKIASTRLKTIGGVAYVPVADVAKAIGQTVVPMAGGLEIKIPSGAMQAGKLSGKIGDVIQTKKYSFQVLGVQTLDSYPSKYLKDPRTYEPDGPTDNLVVVTCAIKNTANKAQGPVLAHSFAGNTAIADYDGQSYPPKYYDARIAGDYSGGSMLPGSKVTFAVVFSVPKTAKLKDLVFSVTDYFDANFKGTDVRISLK